MYHRRHRSTPQRFRMSSTRCFNEEDFNHDEDFKDDRHHLVATHLDLPAIANPGAPTAGLRTTPRKAAPSLLWSSANGHAINVASPGT